METAVLERPSPSRLHLGYLDGIRGLAALFVVYHHVWQRSLTVYKGEHLPFWFHATTIFKFGHYAVGVFIVLSGFCLMLPVARAGSTSIPGGTAKFLKRRARRILPPYYAALAMSIAMIALITAMRNGDEGIFSIYDRSTMAGSILSHLFLVHNLRGAWAFRIDGPMWSVATEWQIYFLFPLLLLPLWRRWGALWTIVIGYVLGLLASRFLPDACFWYLGLFGMGMAGAWLATSNKAQAWARPTMLIGWSIAALAMLATINHIDRWMSTIDFIVGLATMATLVHLSDEKRATFGGRLLSSRPLVALGTFSYSIYLIHFPLVIWIQSIVERRHLATSTDFLVLAFAGVPIMVAIAYAFHRLFERPFMSTTALAGVAAPKGVPVVEVQEPGQSARRGLRWSHRAARGVPAMIDRDAATP